MNLPEGLLNFENWLNYSLMNVHIQYKCKAFSGIPDSQQQLLSFNTESQRGPSIDLCCEQPAPYPTAQRTLCATQHCKNSCFKGIVVISGWVVYFGTRGNCQFPTLSAHAQ